MSAKGPFLNALRNARLKPQIWNKTINPLECRIQNSLFNFSSPLSAIPKRTFNTKSFQNPSNTDVFTSPRKDNFASKDYSTLEDGILLNVRDKSKHVKSVSLESREHAISLLNKCLSIGDLDEGVKIATTMKDFHLLFNLNNDQFPFGNLVHKDDQIFSLLLKISKNNSEYLPVLDLAWIVLKEHLDVQIHLNEFFPMEESLVLDMIDIYTGVQHFEPFPRERLGRSCVQFLKKAGYQLDNGFKNFSLELIKGYIRALGYAGNRLDLEFALAQISDSKIYQELKMDISLAYAYCYELDKSRKHYLELVSLVADKDRISEVCRGISLSYSEIGLVDSAIKIWNNFSVLVGPPNYKFLGCSNQRLMFIFYSNSMKNFAPTKIFSEHFFNSSIITSTWDYGAKLNKDQKLNFIKWMDFSQPKNDDFYLDEYLDMEIYKESVKTLQTELECFLLSNILFPEIIPYHNVNIYLDKIKNLQGNLSQKDYENLLWQLVLSKSILHKETFKKALNLINEALDIYGSSLSNEVFLPAIVSCLPRTITSRPYEDIFKNKSTESYFYPNGMQILHRNRTKPHNHVNQILKLASDYDIEISHDMEVAAMWSSASIFNYNDVVKRFNSLLLKICIPETVQERITRPKTKLQVNSSERVFSHFYAMMARTHRSALYSLNIIYPKMINEFGDEIFSNRMLNFLLFSCEKSASPKLAIGLIEKAEGLGLNLNNRTEESLMRCFFACPHTQFIGKRYLDRLSYNADGSPAKFSKMTYYLLIETYARNKKDFKFVKKVYDLWIESYSNRKLFSAEFIKINSNLNELESNGKLQQNYSILSENLKRVSNGNLLKAFKASDRNIGLGPPNPWINDILSMETISKKFEVYDKDLFDRARYFEIQIGLLMAEAYIRNGYLSHGNYLVENLFPLLIQSRKVFECDMLWEDLAGVISAYWYRYLQDRSSNEYLKGSFEILDLFLERFFYKTVVSDSKDPNSVARGSIYVKIQLHSAFKNKRTLSVMPHWNGFLAKIIGDLKSKATNIENGLEIKIWEGDYVYISDYFKSVDLI
ncbi:hypothetical protein AYI68_g2369 [Smittium mucronatum]|uniref:Uncharacterized protein n=1 Tax=Smittium mucronatum TaxID=133383 RepID=A0A1R0H2Y8_9FUNG|nr:hypothetical protein AYI68_g2369 [Smittium mucronatum]